jgi:hypothetical protein
MDASAASFRVRRVQENFERHHGLLRSRSAAHSWKIVTFLTEIRQPLDDPGTSTATVETELGDEAALAALIHGQVDIAR